MTPTEIRALLAEVEADEYNFELREKDEQMFLLASYTERDIITHAVDKQTTRKWYISPWATKSEIVQTAFKCVLTSMEHRTREMFMYRGKRIFGPHFDCDALHSICGKLDYRPPSKQDGVG